MFYLYSEGISISVDGYQYGNVRTPERGYSQEAANLKSNAGQRWAEGGKDAPFDKEVCIINKMHKDYLNLKGTNKGIYLN